MRAAAFAG